MSFDSYFVPMASFSRGPSWRKSVIRRERRMRAGIQRTAHSCIEPGVGVGGGEAIGGNIFFLPQSGKESLGC